MKILLIADKESPALWDYFDREMLADIDLILSAGDLDPDYLSFLVTFAKGPLLYVPGNHDDRYLTHPPEGCVCIDDMVYVHEGVRILGLGGAMKYKEGPFMHTEMEMGFKVCRALGGIVKNKGFDILLTHAPAYQINDGDSLPHRGFKVFRSLLDRFRPQYFVHGHVHLCYGRKHKRLDHYGETTVINAYERYVIEI